MVGVNTYIGQHNHIGSVPVKLDYKGMLHNMVRDIQRKRDLQERERGIRADVVTPGHHVFLDGADVARPVPALCLEDDRIEVRPPRLDEALLSGEGNVSRGTLPESVPKKSVNHNFNVHVKVDTYCLAISPMIGSPAGLGWSGWRIASMVASQCTRTPSVSKMSVCSSSVKKVCIKSQQLRRLSVERQ
jgi:hypothetical protein